MSPHRLLIVNAQCLGQDERQDRAIIRAFERGFVTSASLIHAGKSAASAVALAKQAVRNPATRVAGRVLTDAELDAIRSTPSRDLGLQLGLMLVLSTQPDDRDSSRDEAKHATRHGRARKHEVKHATRQSSSINSRTSSSIHTLSSVQSMEASIRCQISWFVEQVGSLPLFIHGLYQSHLVSPVCDILAKLAPALGISWICCVQPVHGHCTLAASRTARFIYSSQVRPVNCCEFEIRWTSALAVEDPDFIERQLIESEKGLTDVEFVFSEAMEREDRLDEFQRAFVHCCDRQLIALLDHREAASLLQQSTAVDESLAESLWSRIPSSLLHHIHSFLSPASFMVSRRSCRPWRYESNKPGKMWNRLLFHVHPHLSNSSLYLLARSKLPITRVRVENKILDSSVNEITYIAQLPSLTSLILTGCTRATQALQQFPESLGSLPSLKRLVLTDSELGDEAAPALLDLPALEWLDLSESWLSHQGIALLLSRPWTRLIHLDLSNRNLTRVGVAGSLDLIYEDELLAIAHLRQATQPSARILPVIQSIHAAFPVFPQPRAALLDEYMSSVREFGLINPRIKFVSDIR